MRGVWATLGVESTRDASAIRRAYARQLKVTNPEDDPAGFKALRAAYEQALAWCAYVHDEDDGDEPEVAAPAELAWLQAIAPTPATEAAEAPVAPALELASSVDASSAVQSFEREFGRLEALVCGEAPSDPAALTAAFEALMSSPVLDDVALHDAVERRIAELITGKAPRADALIATAVGRFRWTDDRIGVGRHRDWAIQAVLARADDLRFIVGMNNPDHPDHGAFVSLTREPTRLRRLAWRLTLGRAGKVQAFLNLVDHERHSLSAELNEAAVAWWRTHFERPRMSAGVLWALFLAPPVLALPLMFFAVSVLPAPIYASAYAVVMAASLAAAFAGLYGVSWPRRLWAERWAWRAPLWLRLGWAPGALAVVVAACTLPASRWCALAAGVLSAGFAFWALTVGEPDRRAGSYPWQARALMNLAYLGIWWLLLSGDRLPAGLYPQAALATAGAAAAFSFGAQSLMEWWYGELGERARMAGLATIGVVGMLGVQMLWIGTDTPAAQGLGAALVTLAVLAHKPAQDLDGLAQQVRHYVMWFGMLAMNYLRGSEASLLVLGGAWLSAGVLITVGVGLSSEFRLRRTARG